VIERGEELGASRVRDGDVLIGFGSPGLRSNGYSLARKVLIADEAALGEEAFPGSPRNLGDELLVPSAIYAPAVVSLRRELGAAAAAPRQLPAQRHHGGSVDRRRHQQLVAQISWRSGNASSPNAASSAIRTLRARL